MSVRWGGGAARGEEAWGWGGTVSPEGLWGSSGLLPGLSELDNVCL